jgi:hypothetical protein
VPRVPRLPFDPQTIDVLYGLEPVLESGAGDTRNPTEIAGEVDDAGALVSFWTANGR